LAVRLGPKVARLLIWLEIKLAVLLGLAWFAFKLPWLVLAVLPLLTLGLRIIWGAFTMPEGRGMNKLLALSALQLVAFALLFHILAVIDSK
jgi:1,4-dihydroxy-2-naphthoate polyprenyltransferase